MKLFSKPYEYHLLGVIALYVLGLAIYLNTLSAPFVFDDYPNIRHNPFIRLTHVDAGGLYRAAFESVSPNRPVTNISFAFNYRIGGYHVTGYHLTNILIHIVNAVLVYFLALFLFRRGSRLRGALESPETGLRLTALLAGAVFLAHPIQTQAVTYIVQRMTSMATMFYLASLLLYVLGRLEHSTRRRMALWAGSLATAILALGSKEIAATLPIMILLIEFYFFRDLDVRWLRSNALLVSVLLASLVGVSFLYLGLDPVERLGELYRGREFSVGERLLSELRVLVFYLSLLIFPHPARLSLEHEFPISVSLLEPVTTLVCAIFLAALAISAILLARRHGILSFAIVWYFVTLSVESTFVGLELVYEHRLYLPMMGFAIAVAYLVALTLSRHRALAIGVSLAMVSTLAAGTVIRNDTWQDRISLWTDVVEKNPASHRARNNLGRALTEQGMLEQAVSSFHEALRIRPDYAEPHNNLGAIHAAARRFDQARHHFVAALKLKPDYAQAHNNLGVALLEQGEIEDAIHHLDLAVRIAPRYAKAHGNLAAALRQSGDAAKACDHLKQATRWDPHTVGVNEHGIDCR